MSEQDRSSHPSQRRSIEMIAADTLRCALAHDRAECLLGNVTAQEIARLAASRIDACPMCGAMPGVNIDCRLCDVLGLLENPL